jgi:hypothetical protein
MLHIDWPRLLSDLAYLLGEAAPNGIGPRVPCNIQALADHLSVPRGTLRGWIDGSEPKHADGEQLLDRWRVLTGKPREFAPLERRSFSAHSG